MKREADDSSMQHVAPGETACTSGLLLPRCSTALPFWWEWSPFSHPDLRSHSISCTILTALGAPTLAAAPLWAGEQISPKPTWSRLSGPQHSSPPAPPGTDCSDGVSTARLEAGPATGTCSAARATQHSVPHGWQYQGSRNSVLQGHGLLTAPGQPTLCCQRDTHLPAPSTLPRDVNKC